MKDHEFLWDWQYDAVKNMKNGCILNGGVGSGKSRTSLYYYFVEICKGKIDSHIHPMIFPIDLYIITTARKRDKHEWEDELSAFCMTTDKKISQYNINIIIDSWNNIKKYRKVYGAFFIFDEDKVTGSGVWVKSFLDISRKNKWVILSATPGDCWLDYWAVFVANGFFKNKTEFTSSHVIWNPHVKFPQVQKYYNERILMKMKESILVEMKFERETIPHHIDIWCEFDKTTYREIQRNSWNPIENKPIETASEYCQLLRKIVNSDPSRVNALLDIFAKHRKCIIFYSFDYELDILREVGNMIHWTTKEWNGHKHEEVPDEDCWLYLVNYASGSEAWNCITTDTIIFYSQQYSYKTFVQACGRIDRANTKFKDLYYYHLKSRSTIDLAINRALKDKKDFNERRYLLK